MSVKMTMEELLPFIEEAFKNNQSFKIPVTGTSMLPLLVQGRDFVIIEEIKTPLKTGDLPLYRRADGTFVLHRIVAVNEDGSFVMCGDNQFLKEYGITESNIIGVVTEIIRDGKSFSVEDERYKKYVKRGLILLNVRYPYKRLRYFLHKVKVKLKSK